MKKVLLLLFASAAAVADVPALPSWVTAAPASLPDMPPLSDAEMARSCKNNAHKNDAVTFVREVRYLPVLKDYINSLQADLKTRLAYVGTLQQNIAYLQAVVAEEQPFINELNTQIAQYQIYIQQQQQVLQSPGGVQKVMQDAAAKLQQDQQTLQQLQADLQLVIPKLQNITNYVQWCKAVVATALSGWQSQLSTAQQTLSDDQGQLDTAQQYVQAGYADYQPYVTQYQAAVNQDQTQVNQLQNIVNLYSLAQQIVQAVQGTSYNSPASQGLDVIGMASSFTTNVLQAVLEDLQTYSKYQQEIEDYKTSIPNEINAIAKDLPAALTEQIYELNTQLAQLQAIIAQKSLRKSVVDALNADIKSLNDQVNAIINLIQAGFKQAIQNASATITAVSNKLSAPPSGMFDGCPFFLRDLLKGA